MNWTNCVYFIASLYLPIHFRSRCQTFSFRKLFKCLFSWIKWYACAIHLNSINMPTSFSDVNGKKNILGYAESLRAINCCLDTNKYTSITSNLSVSLENRYQLKWISSFPTKYQPIPSDGRTVTFYPECKSVSC